MSVSDIANVGKTFFNTEYSGDIFNTKGMDEIFSLLAENEIFASQVKKLIGVFAKTDALTTPFNQKGLPQIKVAPLINLNNLNLGQSKQ